MKLKDWMKTKDDTVLNRLARHLALGREVNEGRALHLHPSEMAKSDWCPVAAYYRIKHAREGTFPPAEDLALSTEVIFAEGHAYHDKWQQWFWDMGILFGFWKCIQCRHKWEAKAPNHCPECGASPAFIKYREVPLRSSDGLVRGHADGILSYEEPSDEDPLIEIKSVGVGTVRVLNPRLFMDFKDDLTGMWAAIRRPFNDHLRQGNLYMHFTGRKKMVFLYEPKWGGRPKEFVVTYSPDTIENIIEGIEDIRFALENEGATLPDCPEGTCKYCEGYLDGEATEEDEPVDEHDGQPASDNGGARPTGEAREARSYTRRPRGGGRQEPDDAVHAVGVVGGVLELTTRTRRDRRGRSGEHLQGGGGEGAGYKRRFNGDGSEG